MKGLNLRLESIKLLEENIGRILFDISHSYIFWLCFLKKRKAKINKWDPIKLKIFYTSKETINKTKRHPTEWEKIFTNDMTCKGLISKIYKEFIQIFLQRGHVNGEQASEKMLNITNHHENANQNHKEISLHTYQNGYHQKVHK